MRLGGARRSGDHRRRVLGGAARAGDCRLFGLGGAVTFAPTPFDPPNSTGEFQRGGVAGTHWWICPQANTAGVLMTQRYMGFWNPFFFEFKRLAYQAIGG